MARHGNKKTDPKTLIMMCFLAGAVTMLAAVMSIFSVTKFNEVKKKCTETTTGVVSNVTEEMRTRRRRKRRTTYYVYITDYVYAVGDDVYKASSTLSKSDKLSVGNEIEVNYDPNEPEVCYTVYDDPGSSTVVGIVVVMVLSVIFITAGIRTKRKLELDGGLDGAAMDKLNGDPYNDFNQLN